MDGNLVRRVAAAMLLANRVPTVFHWGGRTDAGGLAPPGIYKLRIEELRRGRTITPSEHIRLVAAPEAGT